MFSLRLTARALAFVLTVSALLFVLPTRGLAHSLPYGVALVWADAMSSAPPVIVTNRGLVFAEGQGAAQGFSIRCNDAYGASTSERPLAYLEANGALTLGIYNRVYQTADRGCSLSMSMGLPDLSITSLVNAPSVPARMYVATRVLQQQAGVFASEDHGRTFSQRFASKANEYYEAIVVAPSDSLRLYALGLHLDRANAQVIYYSSVSVDGGKSWEDNVVSAKITPLAVHPSKPDVVFAYRPTDKYETSFDLLRSDDRGKNYTVVLPGVLLPTGFAGAPDPNTLFFGAGGQGGLYRSRDDGLHFEPLIADQIQRVTCLAEHAGKLWLCANIAPNLDAIWTLKDDASGVDKVMSFDAVSAPIACAEADAGAVCAQPWRDFELEVHPPSDDAGLADAGVPADAQAAIDEEVDAGGESEFDAGDVQDEDEDAALEPHAAHSSRCQFGVAKRADQASSWLLLLGLSALAARRMRRA